MPHGSAGEAKPGMNELSMKNGRGKGDAEKDEHRRSIEGRVDCWDLQECPLAQTRKAGKKRKEVPLNGRGDETLIVLRQAATTPIRRVQLCADCRENAGHKERAQIQQYIGVSTYPSPDHGADRCIHRLEAKAPDSTRPHAPTICAPSLVLTELGPISHTEA